MKRIAMAAVSLLALALIAGCGSDDDSASASSSLPQGSETVKLDPAEFTTKIDNPYWPIEPGSKWTYRETDGNVVQDIELTVLRETKKVAAGITARVIRDVVHEKGRLMEDTFDWYAQDKDGNVWYLGEDTKSFEDSKAGSTKGSWEAGVDGAQGGVVVPAEPKVGMEYRQEYYAGKAEAVARVLSIDEQAEVPFGFFKGVLLTRDYSPLEPKVLEYKQYAKGVGPVQVVVVSGGTERTALVSHEKPGG